MQKSTCFKNFQDYFPKQKKRRSYPHAPSESTIRFILSYADALEVTKTKYGNFKILLN